MRNIVAIALWLAGAGLAHAQQFVVGSFNVESGGAAIGTVTARAAKHPTIDIWGFSEVQNEGWAKTLSEGLSRASGNEEFSYVLGTTGDSDRLAIIYRSSKFSYVRHFELRSEIVRACGQKNMRSPLIAELKPRDGGASFWFMVNHLQRGDEDYRHCQAKTLNGWVQSNTKAMVSVGDYNFDWDVRGGDTKHDVGYDNLTAGNRFKWVRPTTLLKTQCSYDSVLDFVFLSGRARSWTASSEILETQSDYCTADPTRESDHRPIKATISIR